MNYKTNVVIPELNADGGDSSEDPGDAFENNEMDEDSDDMEMPSGRGKRRKISHVPPQTLTKTPPRVPTRVPPKTPQTQRTHQKRKAEINVKQQTKKASARSAKVPGTPNPRKRSGPRMAPLPTPPPSVRKGQRADRSPTLEADPSARESSQ